MSLKMKRSTKENLLIALLITIFFILQISIIYMDRIHVTSFNGVFSAFQYGVCLALIYINIKKGIKISMILMGISVLMTTRAIIMSKSLYPLPGIANTLFYIVTIIVIARFHSKREKENISDYLTSALNRRGLFREISNRIEDRESLHVIYLTIDNFKYINDNYGHVYGDELLREIASRIASKLDKSDKIARINGCDYVVIFKKEDGAVQLANEILSYIKEKAVLFNNERHVECYPECYAGLTSYNPLMKADAETLIKCSDVAMCAALERKQIDVNVFTKEMMDALNRQIEVETYIKEGLDKDYFYMVYQPQFKLGGKTLRGFESLLRMKTPAGELISPSEFIPVAERSELILKIDDYVLRKVMSEFGFIVKKNPELIISANVSAKNICNIDFVDKIKALLNEYSFPACNLEIEITEYSMVESMEVTVANIKRLREMGMQVALDDFGTGYTSLNYVAKMPINLLKVDKSLIDDITNNQKSKEFVQAVISMGHVMGCDVISEGVESEKQLAYLRENGCDFVQGYVWGKPLDYEVAKELALRK